MFFELFLVALGYSISCYFYSGVFTIFTDGKWVVLLVKGFSGVFSIWQIRAFLFLMLPNIRLSLDNSFSSQWLKRC